MTPQAIPAKGFVLGLFILSAIGLSPTLSGCIQDDDVVGDGGQARAYQITRREQLIGGKRALGEVGDYMLENDKIRVIVQDIGFARGFGIYGGGIIDMDLRRASERGGAFGGQGQDMFGEMFPAFFLQALNPKKAEILNDGRNGQPARLRISGYGGEFLTMVKGLNELLINAYGDSPADTVSQQLTCTLGHWEQGSCTALPAEQACATPGGVLCSPQCKAVPRTNAAGTVQGWNWRIPESDIPCTPGVFDPESCLCVNHQQISTNCALGEGPFCDPNCPSEGGRVCVPDPNQPGLCACFDPLSTPDPCVEASTPFCTENCPSTLGRVCIPDPDDPERCRCTDLNGVTRLAEVCPDDPGPLCDPACPAEGFLTGKNGNTYPCQRGTYDAEACACNPLPDHGDGVLCLPYCSQGQPTPVLSFYIDYELPPNASYVKVSVGVTNLSSRTVRLPFESSIGTLLGGSEGVFPVPMGDVFLFSAGNDTFAPGGGLDLRLTLEGLYQTPPELPAIPGLPVEYLATTTDQGVSYGVMVHPGANNYAWANRNRYAAVGFDSVKPWSMLVPFYFSSFTGAFYALAPASLKEGETFSYSKYVMVGDGDAASIQDVVFDIRQNLWRQDLSLGHLEGRLIDRTLGTTVDDAWVLAYRAADPDRACALGDGDFNEAGRLDPSQWKHYTQMITRNGGRFKAKVESGCYVMRAVAPDRDLGAPRAVSVSPGDRSFTVLDLPSSATLNVLVTDQRGVPLPAKVTVVGTHRHFPGMSPPEFLYDSRSGEPERVTDFVPDDPNDPSTRRYIEKTAYTDARGRVSLKVRPSADEPYRIYVSRGVEYNLVMAQELNLKSNQIADVTATLERVVDTTGYISADLHLHTSASIDSSSPPHRQIGALAGEGVEFVAATDHNIITDLSHVIAELGLNDFITTVRGIELTTLEGGHFNAYPLDYWPEQTLHGSFPWSDRPPGEIFADLRRRGALGPERTIVQVNHPRDMVLGYFDQFALSNLDGMPIPQKLGTGTSLGLGLPVGPAFVAYENGRPYADGSGFAVSNFSLDFDAMEILNGKILWEIHSVRAYDPAQCVTGDERLPELPPTQKCVPLAPGELPANYPRPGAVLTNSSGEAAFPGVVNDWFNLINLGHIITGVANSDSHKPLTQEPGFPRNFLRVGHKSVASLQPIDVVEAIQNQRVIMTNGPFLELFVNGAAVGESTVAANGDVVIDVRVQAPKWIEVDLLVVYANGIELYREPLTGRNEAGEWRSQRSFNFEGDTFVVAEVVGSQSLFPVVPPVEVPPIVITEAVGAIGASFGFGASPLDIFQPDQVYPVTPWAMTNPVWVDVDGAGFESMGVAADIDGDGVPNHLDGCPHNPNLIAPGENGCEGTEAGQGGGQAMNPATPAKASMQRRNLRSLFENPAFGR